MPDFPVFSFKISFNTMTKTYNAFSRTEPVANELK